MHDWERGQIDRIYETSMNVAKRMRGLADDIERAVERARDNEGVTDGFRATYLSLPAEVTNLVAWGVANAQIDSPARQLRELLLGRGAMAQINARPIVERLQAFVDAWGEKTPASGDTIYTYITMEGPDDDRRERTHQIDTDLLQEIITLLDGKKA